MKTKLLALVVVVLVTLLTGCKSQGLQALALVQNPTPIYMDGEDFNAAEHNCTVTKWCDQYGQCQADGKEVTCCFVGCTRTTCDGQVIASGCGVNPTCQEFGSSSDNQE